jgi:putative phosphonate metabolism protein
VIGEARYAVYFAPDPTSALWRFGSAVIGYDAATGLDLPLLVCNGWAPEAWLAATEEPRRYGFHATLKAPFRLREGRTEAQLVQALAEFAASRPQPAPVPLKVELVDRFVALIPAEDAPDISALEAAVLHAFEPFRAPLTAQERDRRRPETLTPRQLHALDRWGYPHVLDGFRFHMTLSGRLEPDRAAATRDALANLAADAGLGHPAPVDKLALFRQATAVSRFTIVAAETLSSPAKA